MIHLIITAARRIQGASSASGVSSKRSVSYTRDLNTDFSQVGVCGAEREQAVYSVPVDKKKDHIIKRMPVFTPKVCRPII
jgi:hypothetical protein